MTRLASVVLIAAALLAPAIGCGGLADQPDQSGQDGKIEKREGAAFVGNVWSTSDSPSGYTVRSSGTYACGGYTYKMVATYKQLYTWGSNYDWVDQIGDSSAAINGPVAGGQDVYLSCNAGPGGGSYAFPMYWGNDYYHLHNANGFYCTLKTSPSFWQITTNIAIDGVYYTAYPFSAAPRGELLLHLTNAVAGQVPVAGSGYCGPAWILMQL
jgi:hypothetical protein